MSLFKKVLSTLNFIRSVVYALNVPFCAYFISITSPALWMFLLLCILIILLQCLTLPCCVGSVFPYHIRTTQVRHYFSLSIIWDIVALWQLSLLCNFEIMCSNLNESSGNALNLLKPLKILSSISSTVHCEKI